MDSKQDYGQQKSISEPFFPPEEVTTGEEQQVTINIFGVVEVTGGIEIASAVLIFALLIGGIGYFGKKYIDRYFDKNKFIIGE